MTTKDFEDKVLPLTDRIYPMVARMLGNSESAEDAVQEIMIKLWDRRTKVGEHPNIPGLVFLTARNYCLDQLKKKTPGVDSAGNLLQLVASDGNQNHTEWEELISIVKDVLKELPEDQREIMIMRDLDGYEYTEIPEVTKLKVEHIRVLLSRARKHVGSVLKNTYSYE